MDIEIRHLQMVTAVAASGSVTQAARDLHLTQSAVSHQLRAIEARLGTPLFLRMGKRMVVTAAGGRILETARRVLDEITAAEEDVRRRAAGEASVIRVCAQCNTGYHWLPPLIDAFRQKHPAVDVSIAVECTMRPLEALLEGLLDVAIVTDAVRSSHVRTRPLFEDEHAAIVAPIIASPRKPSSARRSLPTSVCSSIRVRQTTASRSRRSSSRRALSPGACRSSCSRKRSSRW